MMTLKMIEDYELLTIQSSKTLDKLTKNQTVKFNRVIDTLDRYTENGLQGKTNLVFRGDSPEDLAKKLTNLHKPPLKNMASQLFYFGNKAKRYYKKENEGGSDHSQSVPSISMKNIEDANGEVFSDMFKVIEFNLQKPNRRIQKFKKSNKSFSNFFKKEANKSNFISTLRGDQTARDYYLYFLHTANAEGDAKNVILVSTSLSHNKAIDFGGNSSFCYITYYIIPKPIEKYAVSHLRMDDYEKILIEKQMPTYNCRALYSEEMEIAVRGALFPHFILGLEVFGEEKFIVNPHIFKEENNIELIFNEGGLEIDQTDFSERLRSTGYCEGVSTYMDGNFLTVEIEN